MKCHEKTISAQLALSPHNVSPDVLHDRAEPGDSLVTSSIACAACHREHHGIAADLTAIDNAACQTCHKRRFESFAADHPDFGAWPFERRTRIAFNHAAHRDKHFVEKKETFDCRSCHVEDATGRAQILAPYNSACAHCHDEKMKTSLASGAPMFSLPVIDVEALKSAGLDVGEWPKAATGDFDGRLPAAMKLLLAGDEKASLAITALGDNFDFQDLNPKDPQHLKASATLAVAIKKLVHELATNSTTVRERLRLALGREISRQQIEHVISGLSADTLQATAEAWTSGGDHHDGGNSELVEADEPQSAMATRGIELTAFDQPGKWIRSQSPSSLRYRPAGHADPVLATWLDVLAETPDLHERPIAAAMFKELTKPTAPGLCTSCHSIEQTQSGHRVNWHAFGPSKQPRGFTRFSHGPHLTLPTLADCTHCHAIDRAAVTTTAYTDNDPKRFASDFLPLSKSQCVECHTAKAAGDACQQCHNYHVEMASLTAAGAPTHTIRNPQSEIRNSKTSSEIPRERP